MPFFFYPSPYRLRKLLVHCILASSTAGSSVSTHDILGGSTNPGREALYLLKDQVISDSFLDYGYMYCFALALYQHSILNRTQE